MTTPAVNRKLIEVAMPLDVINKASVREKSIRHGHPSTLHLWWSRKPLATCRAVLFAQLVDDPSSHPDRFPTISAQEEERKKLFEIIEKLVSWENSANEVVLKQARNKIRESCKGELPPVADPFSGGGSILLEAQRLGLQTYGSDLNPVAVMIGKAMVEIPPKFRHSEPVHPGGKERNHYRNAEGLSEDIRYYGSWMLQQAQNRIGHLYPKAKLPQNIEGGGESEIHTWIWVRTVPSPDPAFAHINVPIINSYDLSKKKGKEVWVEPIVKGTDYHFEIRSKAEGHKPNVRYKTLDRQGATCILSGAAMPFSYIRSKAKQGHLGRRLFAVVLTKNRGKHYYSPEKSDEDMFEILQYGIEDELPKQAMGLRVQGYGMQQWREIYSKRQLVALQTFRYLVDEVRQRIERDAIATGLPDDSKSLVENGQASRAYAEAVSVYLGFVVDKCADYWSSACGWHSTREVITHTFAMQAIPMIWKYAEVNPFCATSGSWSSMLRWVWKAVDSFVPSTQGYVQQADAQVTACPDGSIISTDPPYYDNIGYADLSDFFMFWMRRMLRTTYPSLFGVLATPKDNELVANRNRLKDSVTAQKYFLNGMKHALSNMARASSSNIPTTIYYAFKQAEIEYEGTSSKGWSTFLQALISAGYTVVRTWPIRTELPNRVGKMGTNALANSIVLVCRKKTDSATTISRAEFIRHLRTELPSAIESLVHANISPADMPQSAVGPGMAVFSRYQAVLESNDAPMNVKTALQLINAELDEYLNDLEGDFDSVTRFAISWFEQNGMSQSDFGSANSIATARGTSVETAKHAGVLASTSGKVRLYHREELRDDWDPSDEKHMVVWKCCQHIIKALETEGEQAATLLVKKIGSAKAEAVKELAYCLYRICINSLGLSKEAFWYNALIAVWPEITSSSALHDAQEDMQAHLV